MIYNLKRNKAKYNNFKISILRNNNYQKLRVIKKMTTIKEEHYGRN